MPSARRGEVPPRVDELDPEAFPALNWWLTHPGARPVAPTSRKGLSIRPLAIVRLYRIAKVWHTSPRGDNELPMADPRRDDRGIEARPGRPGPHRPNSLAEDCGIAEWRARDAKSPTATPDQA